MTTPDIALARRFWMHVHEGGTLTSLDVGRMVTALEELEAKQQETFQMYVDANEARIDAEKKLRKSALQELSALGQASEAYQAQLAAEAKLAKLRTFLDELWDSQGYDARELHDLLKELDGVSDE